MSKIRLSPSASITPMAQAVVLRSDLGSFQLDGPDISVFVGQVLPLLDGSRDLDEVASALPGYTPASVHGLLELLRQKGLVEAVAENAAPREDTGAAQERFFQGVGLAPAAGGERLRLARVLIAGLEPWGVVAACELAAAGVGALHLLDDAMVEADDLLAVRMLRPHHRGRLRREVVQELLRDVEPGCAVSVESLECLRGDGEAAAPGPAGGAWDLVVTGLTADDLFWSRQAAAYAHRAGARSLYGHLEGFEAWIGPAVVPGETACWNCFRLRRLGAADHPLVAHEVDTSLAAAPAARRARSYLAPMAPVAGQLMAIEALKLLTAFAHSHLQGRFIVHNLISADFTHHGVVRMPWCEVCGGAARQSPNPGGTIGTPAAPGQGEDPSRSAAGGPPNLGRVRSAAELQTVLEGWVDPRAGVVRALAGGQAHPADPSVPELPWTATAYLAAYTEGGPVRGIPDPPVGAGKGLTEVEAMLSAAGEAIERYSASRYRKQDLKLASFRELGDAAFDPRRLCLYEESRYDEPDFPFARFDPDRPLHWVRGFWIDNREPVWVPALTVYFNFEVPREQLFCQVSSNGLAAGGDLDDAAVRALFELVERDAFMLSWLCQLPGRALRFDGGGLDAATAEAVRQLGACGASVELYLLDVGLGIPTVVSLGLGDGERWPGAVVALATHVDPRVAARKAVLELGHVGPYVARLMRSGQRVPASPAEVLSLDDHALYYAPVARLPLLDTLRVGGGEPLCLADLPVATAPTLAGCAERLAAAGAGVRVAIVDVTSPDVALGPFRVARALGTDVQPIHFGERLRRLANPRLAALLGPRGVNPQPHPVA
jgi:ribosomal protein S12 methylthiotransferase accessory factor